MSCLIIYQSKSGYTEGFMHLLSEQYPATLTTLKEAQGVDLFKYDCVVFAAGVYAGKISGLKRFQKMLEVNKLKKLAIIAVGAAGPSSALREKLVNANNIATVFNTETSEQSHHNKQFFYLQGGFDPERLNFALKTMLGMVSKNLHKKQLKDPASLTEEDRDFLAFFQTANDHTSKEQLREVVDFLSVH